MSFQWSWRDSRIGSTCVKNLITLFSLSIMLVGCSGGGGGGGGGAPVSTAPVITAECTTTFQSGDYDAGTPPTVNGSFTGTHTGTLVATDPDPITFSLDVNNPMVGGPVMLPSGAMVSLNQVTGDYTYTPSLTGPRGMDSFPFRVDDPTEFSTAMHTVIVNPKIMPLGDSITEGSGGIMPPVQAERVAYRLELLNQLNTAGFEIQYVGELTSGITFLTAEQFLHNGYPGFRDNEIAAGAGTGGAPPRPSPFDQYTGIFDSLNNSPADIILLHIGTNPTAIATVTDAAEVRNILTEIGRWEDSINGNPVTVSVAGIIDRLPTDANVAVRNANVIAMIALGAGADPWPDQIVSGAELDMLTPLYNGGAGPDQALYSMAAPGNTAVHPNAAGYIVMGGVWAASLTGANQPAILQSCP